MKECTYCGKEYPDEAMVCQIDAQPLRSKIPKKTPAPTSERRTIVDSEHLKLLAIFHFIVGGLGCLGGGFVAVHYLIMRTFILNPGAWQHSTKPELPPENFFRIFIWFYICFGFFFLAIALCNFLSGWFLARRKNRMFSLVIGCLDCLLIPFGTVLGVFTIVVLSRESVRFLYGETRTDVSAEK